MKKLLIIPILLFSISFLHSQNYYLSNPEGFGQATTGGGSVTPVIVSNYTDLKAKIKLSTPQVILVSGIITFTDTELQISETVNNKTIIGLPGAKLINIKQTVSTSGILNLKSGSSNVIIRNLIFEGPGAYDIDGRDLLTSEGCINLWVDHCEFQDGIDGNFDIKNTSDNVTVSWCKFTYLKPAIPGGSGGSSDHRFSNLIGSSSSDAPADGHYSVTFQNCYWGAGCKNRMPRVRNGEIHILNCYYNTVGVSSSVALGLGGGTNNTTCYVENTHFAYIGSVYQYYSTDGGTVALTFDDCINGVSNVGTVSQPTYSYSTFPVSDVATAIPNTDCGAGATLQVTGSGIISSSCNTVGNTEYFSDFDLLFFPTLTDQWLHIESKDDSDDIQEITIYSNFGQKIIISEYYNSSYTNLDLDISQLTDGVYFCHIKTENRNTTRKFIKKTR